MPETFRLLTLNAGLLRFLGGLLQPAPHLAARLHAMPALLAALDADVIVLQEVYTRADRELLRENLRSSHPHGWSRSDGRGLGHGLMVVGRAPLDAEFWPFPVSTVEERWFGRKGSLIVRTSAGAFGEIVLYNCHTTAGGLFLHPESPRCDRIRDGQIRALLDRAARDAGAARPIIAGDFNAGPDVSDANYRLPAAHGFVDVFAHLHPGEPGVTWDPENILNQGGPHRACPPQRVDHVFIRRTDLEAGALVPARCEIVLREPCVDAGAGLRVTPSDHYGVLATFARGPA